MSDLGMNEASKSVQNGVVKFYNAKARFGFIRNLANDEELYVRHSGLIDSISDGDAVTFEIEEHPKGPKAINVKLAKSSESQDA